MNIPQLISESLEQQAARLQALGRQIELCTTAKAEGRSVIVMTIAEETSIQYSSYDLTEKACWDAVYLLLKIIDGANIADAVNQRGFRHSDKIKAIINQMIDADLAYI